MMRYLLGCFLLIGAIFALYLHNSSQLPEITVADSSFHGKNTGVFRASGDTYMQFQPTAEFITLPRFEGMKDESAARR